MKLFAAALLAIFTMAPVTASANCSGPAGIRGALAYNDTHDVVQFCDGVNWYALGGGATPAGNDGSIQFKSGANLAADSDLHWDDTNRRLGIGAATPTSRLDIRDGAHAANQDIGINIGTPVAGTGWLGGIRVKSNLSGVPRLTLDVPSGNTFNSTEAISVLGNGNVGIGTGSPNTKLHVFGSTATGTVGTQELIKLSRAVNSGVSFPQVAAIALGTYGIQPGLAPGSRLDFMLKSTGDHDHIADVTVMTMNSNGNVGIGMTTPAARLHARAATDTGTAIQGGTHNGSVYGLLGYNNSWGVVCNGTNCGGSAPWTSYSDARLKDRVRQLAKEDGLSTIMKLRPVRFHWRDAERAQGEQLGLIAQEVEKILPEVIGDPIDSSITLPDGSREEIKGTLNVSYAALVVPLIKAVQELKSENDTLRAEQKAANDKDAVRDAAIEEMRQQLRALMTSQ